MFVLSMCFWLEQCVVFVSHSAFLILNLAFPHLGSSRFSFSRINFSLCTLHRPATSSCTTFPNLSISLVAEQRVALFALLQSAVPRFVSGSITRLPSLTDPQSFWSCKQNRRVSEMVLFLFVSFYLGGHAELNRLTVRKNKGLLCTRQDLSLFKGIVLSLNIQLCHTFTHPLVISNLYEFNFFCWAQNDDILQNVCNPNGWRW